MRTGLQIAFRGCPARTSAVGPTSVWFADEGVSVAVAGHASRKATAPGRVVSEAWGAGLAELAHIAVRAGAHLDPAGGFRPVLRPLGRVQLNVVDEACACVAQSRSS